MDYLSLARSKLKRSALPKCSLLRISIDGSSSFQPEDDPLDRIREPYCRSIERSRRGLSDFNDEWKHIFVECTWNKNPSSFFILYRTKRKVVLRVFAGATMVVAAAWVAHDVFRLSALWRGSFDEVKLHEFEMNKTASIESESLLACFLAVCSVNGASKSVINKVLEDVSISTALRKFFFT